MWRSTLAALRGQSDRSGQVMKGMPKPVWPVVKDFRLKSWSEAMWSPRRSMDAPIILAPHPALRTPRQVPVMLPPPALVQTTASGSRPAVCRHCSTSS